MSVISVAAVLAGDRWTGPADVRLDGDRVVAVDTGPGRGASTGRLTAGMVDLQVNGGFGVDLVTASAPAWEHLAARLAGTGVTAFLPTFITAPVGDLVQAVGRAAAAALVTGTARATRLGADVDGPRTVEKLARVDTVVLCRTGTVTTGVPNER